MDDVEKATLGMLAKLDQDQRAELFAAIHAEYCVCCGGAGDDCDGECDQ